MSAKRFKRWISLLRTLPRLGVRNLARVVVYRLLLAARWHPVCRLVPAVPRGEFFARPPRLRHGEASTNWLSAARYFDNIEVPLDGGMPDWNYRPALGNSVAPSDRSWWEVGDFDEAFGDIKDIWDISRFSWVLALAQRAALGDERSLARLNDWLSDWVEHNPGYTGYNWKCGQEASIRVMHLAMAALILGQAHDPRPGLRTLLRIHLARIQPTVSYAIAQDNNHGVCEAAALFIGGAWLAEVDGDGRARGWMESGRRQLEERAARLIAEDGSFSMYSVMYHREFLDAMSMVEVWRRALDLPAFSDIYRARAAAAAEWLRACAHPASGDAPNIGANDGTRLLPLTDSAYRDFRPAVQLACVLFCGARAYGKSGHWDIPLQWLDIPKPDAVLASPRSWLSRSGGLAFLKAYDEDVQVFVRFPGYRFRPSHADPLHLDLWINGRNILRGPGSYRYNAEPEWLDYFPGVAAHNTVQFDGTEAMPRLGRFLFGDWLRLAAQPLLEETVDGQIFVADCRHACGAYHQRKVSLTAGKLEVSDSVAGFGARAVVRWRLMPGDWRQDATGVSLDRLRLTVRSNDNVLSIRLVDAWEALCYGAKSQLPVLEIEMTRAGRVVTCVEWNAM